MSSDHLWNALTEGGEASTQAIANFTTLSERQRDAAFEQLMRRAEGCVATLIAEERTGDRQKFRESKARLIRVLDAIPSLAVTETLREVAHKRVADIDKQTEPLTNIDIAMKCDELAKQLKPATLRTIAGTTVIECESMEDLKQQLTKLLPPEIIDHVISQIDESGGDIILGSLTIQNKKNKPPPPNN